MAKGKRKNPTNRNQDHSPSSEPRTPTSPNPGHPNTPEKVDLDLKAYLMTRTWNMARKLKIMENEKHPLDDLKNDEITKKREK